MFIDNDWWGHKHVLAKFCGVKDQPIFGSLQHGVITSNQEKDWDLSKDRNITSVPFFCYSNALYKKSKNNNLKNIISIGSPFLYLDKITPQIKKKKGTIVFPAHGDFNLKKKGFVHKFSNKKRLFDHEGFIKNVEKNNSPPYTVSIIKDDFEYMKKFYKRKNWKIFSSGNRFDKFFLINSHKLISQNTHAVFCEFTSAIFYSMYLGLKVRIAVKSPLLKKIVPYAYWIPKPDRISFEIYRKIYPEIFFGKLPVKLAKNIAKERMGYDCLKSKKELKKILGWDSKLKTFTALTLKKLYNIKYQYKKISK